jgi:hypothetical protein
MVNCIPTDLRLPPRGRPDPSTRQARMNRTSLVVAQLEAARVCIKFVTKRDTKRESEGLQKV